VPAQSISIRPNNSRSYGKFSIQNSSSIGTRHLFHSVKIFIENDYIVSDDELEE
jgi:hypothetical protein